jgi:hypothetical protein
MLEDLLLKQLASAPSMYYFLQGYWLAGYMEQCKGIGRPVIMTQWSTCNRSLDSVQKYL